MHIIMMGLTLKVKCIAVVLTSSLPYRTFIWRCLLRLPDNYNAYSSLLDKGTHPAFITLHQTYPIKSRKLLRVLQRYHVIVVVLNLLILLL